MTIRNLTMKGVKTSDEQTSKRIAEVFGGIR